MMQQPSPAMLLQAACNRLGFIYAEIWRPRASANGTMLMLHSTSANEDDPEDPMRAFASESRRISLAAGSGLPGRVWATRQPEWSIDVRETPPNRFVRVSIAKTCGLAAAVGIPLLSPTDSIFVGVAVFFAQQRAQSTVQIMQALGNVGAMLAYHLSAVGLPPQPGAAGQGPGPATQQQQAATAYQQQASQAQALQQLPPSAGARGLQPAGMAGPGGALLVPAIVRELSGRELSLSRGNSQGALAPGDEGCRGQHASAKAWLQGSPAGAHCGAQGPAGGSLLQAQQGQGLSPQLQHHSSFGLLPCAVPLSSPGPHGGAQPLGAAGYFGSECHAQGSGPSACYSAEQEMGQLTGFASEISRLVQAGLLQAGRDGPAMAVEQMAAQLVASLQALLARRGRSLHISWAPSAAVSTGAAAADADAAGFEGGVRSCDEDLAELEAPLHQPAAQPQPAALGGGGAADAAEPQPGADRAQPQPQGQAQPQLAEHGAGRAEQLMPPPPGHEPHAAGGALGLREGPEGAPDAHLHLAPAASSDACAAHHRSFAQQQQQQQHGLPRAGEVLVPPGFGRQGMGAAASASAAGCLSVKQLPCFKPFLQNRSPLLRPHHDSDDVALLELDLASLVDFVESNDVELDAEGASAAFGSMVQRTLEEGLPLAGHAHPRAGWWNQPQHGAAGGDYAQLDAAHASGLPRVEAEEDDDEAGGGGGGSPQKQRRVRKGKELSFAEVSRHFDLPLTQAAERLNVCVTLVKRVCRENGVSRWPYRKLQSRKKKERIAREASVQREGQSPPQEQHQQPQPQHPSRFQTGANGISPAFIGGHSTTLGLSGGAHWIVPPNTGGGGAAPASG